MKNKSTLGKKVNQYKTTYYKEIGVLLGLIITFLIMSHGVADYGDEKYVAEPVSTTTQNNHVGKANNMVIEDKIKHYFKRSHPTMIAVAYAESGMSNSAINYNC